ncbi:MAG TPA: hypothetical protein VFB13_17730 [Reyranella sp.]|nr:hypothetical protein [Reyranella sp.]
MQKSVVLAMLSAALLLAACSGEPVVADISQDKVILQGNGAKPEQLMAKANESCSMYHRHAQALSQRCGDEYCIQKYYLFACRD